MGKINIAGKEDIIDPSYRYQMEKINVTYEKNKSIITNIDAVALDIGRDASLIASFFQKYFGSGFIYKNSKLTTSIKKTANEFQDALKDFIEYCVLCPTCTLPETHILVGKNIGMKCDCCGHRGAIDIHNVTSKPMKSIFDIMSKASSGKRKKGEKRRKNEKK